MIIKRCIYANWLRFNRILWIESETKRIASIDTNAIAIAFTFAYCYDIQCFGKLFSFNELLDWMLKITQNALQLMNSIELSLKSDFNVKIVTRKIPNRDVARSVFVFFSHISSSQWLIWCANFGMVNMSVPSASIYIHIIEYIRQNYPNLKEHWLSVFDIWIFPWIIPMVTHSVFFYEQLSNFTKHNKSTNINKNH